MKMNIKEAYEIISRPFYMLNVPQEIIDAHRVAIESMRKCYEIEKIIHDRPYGGGATVKKIREVIEDEIIDNVRGNRATELLEHISALSTKEEVIATLTEIQLEIEEKATELCDNGWWLTYNDLIQQKINAVKGE